MMQSSEKFGLTRGSIQCQTTAMTHPLTDWLEKNKISRRRFAATINVHEATLERLVLGKSDTTTTLIRIVSQATDNEVSEIDLYKAWLLAYSHRAIKELSD